MSIISNTIKQKAKENGLSINRLEQNAGLKKGTVYNILLGRSKNPGIYTIQQLAIVLNCSVSDLFENKLDTEVSTINFSQNDDWDSVLYIKCLSYLVNTAKAKNISLSKQKAFALTDEIYLYSLKGELKTMMNKVDQNFSNWLLEKWLNS